MIVSRVEHIQATAITNYSNPRLTQKILSDVYRYFITLIPVFAGCNVSGSSSYFFVNWYLRCVVRFDGITSII